MALENEIKKLTEQMEILNGHFAHLAGQGFFVEPQIKDSLVAQHEMADAIIEEIKDQDNVFDEAYINPAQTEMKFDTPVKIVLNHDDLKHACLTATRKNADNKAIIKSILGEYNAVRVSDVPNDKLDEVIAKIKAI